VIESLVLVALFLRELFEGIVDIVNFLVFFEQGVVLSMEVTRLSSLVLFALTVFELLAFFAQVDLLHMVDIRFIHQPLILLILVHLYLITFFITIG
jgi:hypothetical protein